MTMYYDKENTELSFGWERPTVVTLGSAAPSATTISGFSGLTTNALAGQMLRICSGNQKGYNYSIISNTATVVTVEGVHTPSESGAKIGSGDRVAYSTTGIEPTLTGCNIWFGIADKFTPPARENDVASLYAHGSGTTRLISFIKKITFDGGSIPIALQDDPKILLALGNCAITGTTKAGGLSTTLNGEVSAWDNVITLGSKETAAVDDYIQIGTGDTAEVRKISSLSGVGSKTCTLDQPLDFGHATAEAVTEVEAPWSYVCKPNKYYPRSFTIVRQIDDPTGTENPLVHTWSGCFIDSADFSSSEDQEFQMNIGIKAMTDHIFDDGSETPPTVTADTGNPFYWDNSTVSYNSVAMAIIRSFRASWKNNLQYVWAHGVNNDKEPYRVYRQRPTFDGSYTYIPVSTTLLKHVDDDTEYDSYVQFDRGSNDVLKIEIVDAKPIKDAWESPDQGYFESEHQMSVEQVNVTLTYDDTDPFY